MNKNLLSLALILILALFFHLIMLDKIPPGLTNDEVNLGYDAYSILKTGKDQWGEFFPLEFKGFGDYRLPVFTYSTVPFIALTGVGALSLRLTAIVYGLLLILISFVLAKKLFNETVGLITALFLVISPWFFSLTRLAIESPPATLFVILGIYFFIKALERGRINFIFSSIFFVISFYTYYSTRLFNIIFLLSLLLIFKKKLFQHKKWLLAAIILAFILCLPIFRATLNGGANARLQQTNLTKDIGILNLLNDKRGECLNNLPFFICRSIYNKPVLFTHKFINNYFNHFSFNFLFLKDSARGIMGDIHYFFIFFIPLFIVGIYYLFKNSNNATSIIISWLLIAPIPDSLTSEGHFSRAFLMIIPVCLICAWGIFNIYKTLKNNFFKKIFFLGLFIIVSFELVNFLTDYFFYYPRFFSIYTHYEYQPLFDYLKEIEKNYDHIYISRRYHDTKQYAFYLFYTQYDPKKYQEKKEVNLEIEKDGWIWVKRIGKWHFVASIPSLEEVSDKSLLIGDTKEEINNLITSEIEIKESEKPIVKLLKTINYLNGDPAFSIAEVIKK